MNATLPTIRSSQRTGTRPKAPVVSQEPEGCYEIVDGVLEERAVGAEEVRLANRLNNFLGPFVLAQQSGQTFVEMHFELPPKGNDRQPDLAYVRFKTWPENKRIPPGRSMPVVPELAVEVISPSEWAHSTIEKLHEYFEAGVQEVWQVWPHVEQLYIYTSPTQLRILNRSEELTGGSLIPGFRLPLEDLFPAHSAESTS
jgi:Uma2 family endonuclease